MKQKLRGTAKPASLVERNGQCGFHPIAPAVATRTVEPTDRPLPGEEFYRRSDLGRCELIEGTIKERPPATGHSHGRLEFRVAQRLGDFCGEREVGEVMVGEVGIYTARDPDGIRAADVVLMSHDRLDQIQSDSFLDVPPELVVEIMSPENKWEEMHRKLQEYLGIGVDTVWIVEPSNRSVQVYQGIDDVQTLGEEDVLAGDGPIDGLTIEVGTLFG